MIETKKVSINRKGQINKLNYILKLNLTVL